MKLQALVLFAVTAVASAAAVEPIGRPIKVPCQSELHPCNRYHLFKKCSPSYVKTLTACVQSGCIQWIRDPLEDCYKKTADA